ncbi:MAG: serine protease Do [Verrucomicrobiota bacterium]|jgi:hypothetical protein
MILRLLLILSISIAARSASAAQTRDQMVLSDRDDVLGGGRWIYNDLKKGLEEAGRDGKPLLVVLRCVPCVACAAFDGQVLRYDEELQKLMEKFVRVRIVQANALDLSLFQFDTDVSFAAFFLNANRTVYGRYGTRSDRQQAEKDITMEGFRAALAGALKLHQGYPTNQESLRGKQPLPVKIRTPEQYPALAVKYSATLDYTTGKVAASCIHCHQLGEAQRKLFRAERQPIPDESLHPWPMPEVVGLFLDPKTRATVSQVAPGSAAARAGFRTGDEIVSLENQPLLSIADAQWILHHASAPASLNAVVQRSGGTQKLEMNLEKEWRRHSDISWRVSTWDLRRMATGGLVFKDLTTEERRVAGLGETALGLRVDFVGQYNDHAAGKRAGFLKNDVLVECDKLEGRMSESQLIAHLLQKRMPGDHVPAVILRGGKRLEMELPMQ